MPVGATTLERNPASERLSESVRDPDPGRNHESLSPAQKHHPIAFVAKPQGLPSTPSKPHAPVIEVSEHTIELPMKYPPSQPASSGSDSDEEDRGEDFQRNREVERLRILAAAGLVKKPESQLTASPSNLPLSPRNGSSDKTLLARGLHLRTSSQAPTPLHSQFDSYDSEDGLMKMEDALARYLKLQHEAQPRAAPRTLERLDHDSASKPARRTRPASQSVSISSSSSSIVSIPRLFVPDSTPSGTTGFRSWLSNVSRTVSAATSGSGMHSTDRPSSRPPISSPSLGAPIPMGEKRRPSIGTPSFSSSGDAFIEDSGTLGQTWASLVDPETLKKCSEKERNRQEAIFELINTEAIFVKNCQILTQVFYSRLETTLGSRPSMVIFANIEDITLFGTTFLSALEERQKQSKNDIEMIGDVVCNYVQGIDVYQPYCTNQPNASRLISRMRKNQNVNFQLSNLKVRGLELEHYLLQPMQRLTRYPLLLEKILKYTEESSPDYRLIKSSLRRAQEVLTATNEAIREQENEFSLVSLSENLMIPGSDAKLNLLTMTRFVGPRRLIRDGIVTKSRSRKTFHAYLFNDFFLLTTLYGPSSSSSGLGSNAHHSHSHSSSKQSNSHQQQLMYRAPMALEECQFKDGKDDSTFVVIHGSESYSLKVVDGPRACTAWKEDAQVARKDVLVALAAQKSKRASVDPLKRASSSPMLSEESKLKNSDSINEIGRPDDVNDDPITSPRPKPYSSSSSSSSKKLNGQKIHPSHSRNLSEFSSNPSEISHSSSSNNKIKRNSQERVERNETSFDRLSDLNSVNNGIRLNF